ncbi:hypothetical protein ACFLR8_01430 [Bacteroidota bacterium]
MIIQFSHNGAELNLSRRSPKNGIAYRFDNTIANTGFRFWNNEPSHKRKYIKSKGWYLENTGNSFNPIPKKGELCFWGEWEPQSRFELTGNRFSNKPSLPHAQHYPMFSIRGIGGHNTDPFVFGEHFYYTNCKQNSYSFLRTINNDSIIIYGSERDRRDFVIDTVFVVGTSELMQDYHQHPTNFPLTLRQATIDLNGGLPNYMRLYQGKMYDFNLYYSEEKPYTFCFVPCKTDCDALGFERPVIDWQRLNLKTPGAGTATKSIDYNSENDFWHDLVAELIKQGFSLGIKLEMPINNDSEEFPEYEKHDTKCGGRC